jgi:hypothetical protein
LDVFSFPNNILKYEDTDDDVEDEEIVVDEDFEGAPYKKPFAVYVSWSLDTIYLYYTHLTTPCFKDYSERYHFTTPYETFYRGSSFGS